MSFLSSPEIIPHPRPCRHPPIRGMDVCAAYALIFSRRWKNDCVFSISDGKMPLIRAAVFGTIHGMKHRTIGFPAGSFFLFGPRGTGKTVWLAQQFPEAYTVNLLEADVRRGLTSRPESLKDIIDANADRTTFISATSSASPTLNNASNTRFLCRWRRARGTRAPTKRAFR